MHFALMHTFDAFKCTFTANSKCMACSNVWLLFLSKCQSHFSTNMRRAASQPTFPQPDGTENIFYSSSSISIDLIRISFEYHNLSNSRWIINTKEECTAGKADCCRAHQRTKPARNSGIYIISFVKK